jgi:hypothetical protein
MPEAEYFERFVEFLTANAGREAHVEIGQRASDIPEYDDIIATLDGRLGEPRTAEHPGRGGRAGYVTVGEEYKAGGRFTFEQRRFERSPSMAMR